MYSSTSDTVDGLDCDTSYDFQVRARGDGSPYSYTYGNPSSSVSRRTTECPVAPAPTNLSATASGQSTVTLRWNPVADAQYYKLERSTSRTGTWTDISETIGGTSRTVYGLECNTLYYFKVSARGDGHPYSTTFGQQSSGDVSRRTTECPTAPAPIGFEVTASTETTITLEWFWVRDAQHYKLERSLDGSTGWTLADAGADSITSGVYRVTGLACNTTYYFRVSACGDGHPYSTTYGTPSPNSNARTTSACTTAAPAPTGLMATASTETSVSLSWNPVTDAYRYRLEHSESSSGPWTAETETSSASDTVGGLNCDTTYYFRVRARGDGSPYSTTFGTASGDVSETTSTCPNRPPAFNNAPYSFSVNEDDANGTRVGTVVAADPDAGDAVSYSITPASTKFAIGSTSGVITVADVLDHEAQSSYVLTVEANDSNGGRGTATVSIVVTDVNEVSISGPGNVVEGADMTFTVTAEQGGVTVTYDIGGTATRGDDYVDPGLGPLTVTIPAGETTRTIVVDTESDSTDETFESVVVTLTGVAVGNAVVDSANSTATARIADLINVSSIDDDDEAPPIVVDTSEPTSTIWFELDTDGGGILDFDDYGRRAYVLRVQWKRDTDADDKWVSAIINSAHTKDAGADTYQTGLPSYVDLEYGQIVWIEGRNPPAARRLLLEVEPPVSVSGLANYRITFTKPDFAIVSKPTLSTAGRVSSDEGHVTLTVTIRNSSESGSASRDDDYSVDYYCSGASRSRVESLPFEQLRPSANSDLIQSKNQTQVQIHTICLAASFDGGGAAHSADTVQGIARISSDDWTQDWVLSNLINWPFDVKTLWHPQNPVVGGVQMLTNRFCTVSFPLTIRARGTVRAGSNAMSTTAHCVESGDNWEQGSIGDATNVELGTTLDALLPANMTCAILNGDSNTETPDNCHKGDQAYATGRSPVAASRIFRPAVKNLLNQADGLSIQHFDEHSSNQFRIVGARPPDSHDTVHKVGRTTGWTSGTIKVFADPDRTCPGNPLGTGDNDRDRDPNDPGDDFFIECLVWTLYQSEGGDSGSPVFVEKTGSVGAVREVLLVGVHYAGAADEGLFIPIERIYAESLLQDYDWLLDEIRPLPALNDDFDEGLEMDEAGRTIVATFDMKDFGHGPGLAYEAVLYRKVGTVTSQVTDTFGSVYKL